MRAKRPGGKRLGGKRLGAKHLVTGYESHGRAEPKKPVIVFSCICSNEFKILISFTLILPYM